MKKHFFTGLKGFGMGAANVVPGVSGGTVALLTGIYSDIVASINAISSKESLEALRHGKFGEFARLINLPFLLALGAGMVLSIFSLAKLVTWTLGHYPILTWAYFFGLILASVVFMMRDIKGWNAAAVAFAIGGAVLGVTICTLSPHQTPDGLWFIFICGLVSICTMILPGISGSFVLLILGKYDYIMQAVSGLDVPVLLVFALGCIIGILAFAKFLHWLLGKWEKQTMLVLLGFVLGSLVKVWPWADTAAISEAQIMRNGVPGPLEYQIGGAVLCCLAGIATVTILELTTNKKTDNVRNSD
ncbi:MAG: DUF368 domain-containing protein [Bacteroidales bacterium]|nr:DUF368 domain-containing protein [Bacteroidales bacterium]